MNLSLLCKWWWRLETEDGIWQSLIKNKYIKDKMISNVPPRVDDSPVWKDLMKVRNIYLAGRKVKVQDGKSVQLRQDCWLEDQPLCVKFPILFELCDHKNISVRGFVDKEGFLTFRRWLPSTLQAQWEMLKQQALNYPFLQSADVISWKWSPKGVLTVKSTYARLSNNDRGEAYSKIWKAKLPYKIKIFLWLVENEAILTKDNMVKRTWLGDPSCRFCTESESIQHLFFTCSTAKVIWSIVACSIGANDLPNSLSQYWAWCEKWIPTSIQLHAFVLAGMCWATWKARNKACFENKLIKHPAEIVCHACSLLIFWAGLHKEELQSQIKEGVGALLALACQMLSTQRRSSPRMILPPPDNQGRDDAETPEDEDA